MSSVSTEPCVPEWECEEDDDDGLNDDLYGDLESTIFERTTHQNQATREELEKGIAKLEETLTKYVKERIELKTQIRNLKKENALILKNASSLYETAKFEVDRKNLMLTQLQTRLQEFTKRTGPNNYISNDEVNEVLQTCREVALETGKSISTDEMKRAIEEFKQKSDQKPRSRPVWSKKIHFNNMSIYYHSEQIPFNRLEKVTFLKPNRSVSAPNPNDNLPESKEENQPSGLYQALEAGELKPDSPSDSKSSKERTETSITPSSTPSEDNHISSRRRNEERSLHHRSNSRDGKSDPATGLRTNSSRIHSENHVHIERERERDRERSRNHYYNNSRRDSRSRSPRKRRRSPDRSRKRRSNSRIRNRGSDPERDRPPNPSKSYKGTSSHRPSHKYDR